LNLHCAKNIWCGSMIKLYIDDTRTAPEGWHQCWNINEAHDFIEENAADISHIDFDYYLSEDMPERTSALLIRYLLDMKRDGIDVFHQPIGNYTFHSSDEDMNVKMRELVAERAFGIKPAKLFLDELIETPSRLQRMLKSKGRR
jgi:hypothetical protein